MPTTDLKLEGRAGADVTLIRGKQLGNWTMRVRGGFLTLFRMIKSDSSPIRTPSYIVNSEIELAWKGLRLDFTPFGHHSNGQDGCPLKTAGGECVTNEDILTEDEKAATKVNFKDGDFSTNYSRAGLR